MKNNPALIEITPEKHGVVVHMAYATNQNMLGKAVYQNDNCLLHSDAADALSLATSLAELAGYKIKILDAYRSQDDHKRLWNFLPDPNYVADIATGSNHSRGVALDVTLVDQNNCELDMGTDFDVMEETSGHFHPTHPPHVQINRLVLLGIMKAAGFVHISTEWWHYELPDAKSYPFIK